MPCCGGQPLAYLRREVADRRDAGLRAQGAHEVADVETRDRRDGSPAHAGGGDTGWAGFLVDSPAIMTRASVLSERR